jgi:hypothetical protein
VKKIAARRRVKQAGRRIMKVTHDNFEGQKRNMCNCHPIFNYSSTRRDFLSMQKLGIPASH